MSVKLAESASTLLMLTLMVCWWPAPGVDGSELDLGAGLLIRGIPLERAALYDPAKDFVCLDRSAKVPFAFVNDDYCDCADGSDEPGTAACPDTTFFCSNAGHVPQVIPSSRVNDGICDCCDTSDEYQEGSSCVNTCSLLGEAAREHYLKAMREHEAGFKSRMNLVGEANAKRNELEAKVKELKALRETAEQEMRDREAAKKEVEAREAAALAVHRQREEEERQQRAEEEKAKREEEMKAVWQKLDVDVDGLISLAEVQADLRLDQNKDGVVSVEEARFFVLNQDSMTWEDFSRTGWILMRPYVSDGARKPMFTPPEADHDPGWLLFVLFAVGLAAILFLCKQQEEEEEHHQQQEEEKRELGQGEDEHAEEERGESEEEENKAEDFQDDYEDEVPDDVPEPSVVVDHGYDEETQLLVDEAEKARKEFNEADRTLRDLEHELNSISATLEKDFGPEDAFLPLEGQCMEHTDREYLYKICWFGQATQKPRHGGGETKLGSWKAWAGPESNPHEKMMFENGLGCWNGPNRSAHVHLTCGKENRIVSASEPSRCMYHFDVETPAMCAHPPALPEASSHLQWHEEL
ncbi:unnamed protein product [Notodromas monacha]|uniref:Glucosidase 2 subunit beta n=1 Tax=Notodromas monacha TaxID=399045 RepID=A0A7R9BFG4_9CRUS|nr:unnamed protein product [Notodromas monacha]CAG0913673.1 unnamed protein product [Notodromas monacha]